MMNKFTVQIDNPKSVTVKKFWKIRGVRYNACACRYDVMTEQIEFDKPDPTVIAQFLDRHKNVEFCNVIECYKLEEDKQSNNPYQE